MSREGARNLRSRRAGEAFRSAAESIGPISAGMSLFLVTRGQWGFTDAIVHVLDEVGPAWLSVWAWAAAEYDVQCLLRLRADRRLTGARLMIDPGARRKGLAVLEAWLETFGPDSVRLVRNHSKMATLSSESGLRLLLRGSGNLNYSPRIEQFDISEGCPGFDVVRGIEEELPVLPLDAPGGLAYEAAGLSQAFSAETLSLFTRGRAWRP